jgi:hypothetical protein
MSIVQHLQRHLSDLEEAQQSDPEPTSQNQSKQRMKTSSLASRENSPP